MAFTDMTASFAYRTHIVWSDFDALADNAKGNYDALNCPQFGAYRNATQTIGAYSQITANTEDWDTKSDYDTTTYRFTPSSAGKYFVINQWSMASFVGDPGIFLSLIGKTAGSSDAYMYYSPTTNCGEVAFLTFGLFDMNGSTDYFRALGWSSSRTALAGPIKSFFQGAKLPAY